MQTTTTLLETMKIVSISKKLGLCFSKSSAAAERFRGGFIARNKNRAHVCVQNVFLLMLLLACPPAD